MPFLTPTDAVPYFGARLRGACEEAQLACVGWRRRPEVRFLVLAQGRTGSTLLTGSLDSHPEIRCADEILRFPRVAPVFYVERASRRVPARAFGFHVKPMQLAKVQGIADWPGFLEAMRARGWRIVHLWRENALAQFLSWKRAEALGRTHARSSREVSAARVRLDPRAIVRKLDLRVRSVEAERAALRRIPHVALCYERDLCDPAARAHALRRVLGHIGVAEAPMSSPLRRTGGLPLAAMIENYDEIAAALAGTPHERFLEPHRGGAAADGS